MTHTPTHGVGSGRHRRLGDLYPRQGSEGVKYDMTALRRGAVIALVVVAGCSAPATPKPTAAPVAHWTPPTGFAATSQDPLVAAHVMAAGSFACHVADRCWGMEFVARDGCPDSLYVELQIKDDSGAAVGYTNDVATTLAAGQVARMVFDNIEDTGHKADLAQVICR